jgi:hypothetical protein
MCCCDEQEMLVSLLDVRELLALRLVSPRTRAWVDAVMPKHPSKAFTLKVLDVNDEEENESDEDDDDSDEVKVNKKTVLDKLMDEETDRIPFFRRLYISDSSFFSHPLIPSFLRTYGPQIHTVVRCSYQYKYYSNDDGNEPEQVAFYQALPNLTQLSTRWLGDSVPDVKMPALQRLQLGRLRSEYTGRAVKLNFDFLQQFPKLRHFWLPKMTMSDYVKVLCALGPYIEAGNRGNVSCGRTLTIFVDFDSISYENFDDERRSNERVARLLRELAVAEGRILIEKMPVQLLDEAVRLFHHQLGGQLLRSFGKCIRSLIGFLSSLYELELPNMRKLDATFALDGTSRNGDYSRTVSWPNLEHVKVGSPKKEGDVSYMAKLVFGSGVLRPSVKRLYCDLKILAYLGSNEAHLLLLNFPNLTCLTLSMEAEEVGLFHSLMRVLPASCQKINILDLSVYFLLGDEDFLGVDDEGLLLTTPPLLHFKGKEIVYIQLLATNIVYLID